MTATQQTQTITKDQIVLLYQSLYRCRYNSPEYKFKPTEKALQQIEKFIKEVDLYYSLHSVGINFLVNYFLFQFNRVSEQTINRFASKQNGVITAVGKIQVYDIIGSKAFLYYRQRNWNFDFIIEQSPFIKKYNISITYLKKLVTQDIKEKPLNRSEEQAKKRFHGTVKGTTYCIDSTSLFNHLSSLCALCFFKSSCKQLLKQNYPEIYIERGYVGTGN